MAGLRVVLDTNVLMSGLAYPGSVPGRIVTAWRQAFEVALSRYILDELVGVLPRLPRIQITRAEVRDLADRFKSLAEVVEPEGSQDANLRDPADQPRAAHVIGGEGRLPAHRRQGAAGRQYPILTPAEFWARHGV